LRDPPTVCDVAPVPGQSVEGGVELKFASFIRQGLIASALAGLTACGGAQSKPDAPEPLEGDDTGKITIVEYDKKAAELLVTTNKLNEMRSNVDEVKRRLQVICVDYPDHQVCQPQTQAEFARTSFCSDKEFTAHIDEIVDACHQGECKQVDQAEQISRSQYMILTQRLPHLLVTFNASGIRLDQKDKVRLQQFVEAIGAEQGYVIIVGRASKDGNWRENLKLALGRAENTRKFAVDELGLNASRVGYITYGADKMYLTSLDAERLSEEKLTEKQANRSALVFAYPCFDPSRPRKEPSLEREGPLELPRVQ